MYPENEKYLKYFSMYLYLNTFAFKSICIWIHLNVFDPMSGDLSTECVGVILEGRPLGLQVLPPTGEGVVLHGRGWNTSSRGQSEQFGNKCMWSVHF